MPTYLYECPIHQQFEYSHSINEVLTLCPKCQENNVSTNIKRLIASENGFILTGGGWSKEGYS